MKKAHLTILVILNCLQFIALTYLLIEFRAWDKLALFRKSHSIVDFHQPHLRNSNFRAHLGFFNVYGTPLSSHLIVGDSMVSSIDWKHFLNRSDVVNLGIPGDSLPGILHRIDQHLLSTPASITLWIGVNDVLQGKSPKETIALFKKLKIKLSGFKGPICLVGITPLAKSWRGSSTLNLNISKVNHELTSLCQISGWKFLNSEDILATQDGFLDLAFTYDGLHLDAHGYKRISEEIGAFIEMNDSP